MITLNKLLEDPFYNYHDIYVMLLQIIENESITAAQYSNNIFQLVRKYGSVEIEYALIAEYAKYILKMDDNTVQDTLGTTKNDWATDLFKCLCNFPCEPLENVLEKEIKRLIGKEETFVGTYARTLANVDRIPIIELFVDIFAGRDIQDKLEQNRRKK